MRPEPLVRFGRESTGELEVASRREWLVTNGLGGYASGTVAGVATRRYHGILIAALDPPVDRTVLVAATREWAIVGDRRFALSTHVRADGSVEPEGYRLIESFELDGMLPVWHFALGASLLERRVWMARGRNVSYVGFRILRGGPVDLEITPLLTMRDHHSLASPPAAPVVVAGSDRLTATFDGGRASIALVVPGGCFATQQADAASEGEGSARWPAFLHWEERARGLDDTSIAFDPGSFRVRLVPGRMVGLVAAAVPANGPSGSRETGPGTARRNDARRARVPQGQLGTDGDVDVDADIDLDIERTLATARARQAGLIALARDAPGRGPAISRSREGHAPADATGGSAATPRDDGFFDQLVLAADQFLVERRPAGRTVIAGYHWFNDWGRDTMIALPGLTLATGRAAEGAAILRSFAPYVRDGLLPNNFPDHAGVDPGYNTVDASLWYVIAIARHHDATGDDRLLAELLPVVREIVDRHRAGTRYGIGADGDGLLRAGGPGLQLTWMDVRIGDRVVTPRTGKPVEINALWYNAVRFLAGWLASAEPAAAEDLSNFADRIRSSFRARFARADVAHLADVVDGPDGDDWRLRPNQVLAASLPHPLLDPDDARHVVDAVGGALVTSLGLRSLDPADPDYHGTYGGDLVARDSAYHQGPVWTWLIGPFVEAYLRTTGDAATARTFLEPFRNHVADAGLGSVSEILEGDPPHRPRGCIAQAWGVAEVLRTWQLTASAGGPLSRH